MKIDEYEPQADEITERENEQQLMNRRNFLRSLGKWSLAVIGCVTLGTDASAGPKQTAWVNRRGGGGGGGAWANRAGGGGAWVNGGGGWINRGGSWVNGGGGGGSWVNRRGY